MSPQAGGKKKAGDVEPQPWSEKMDVRKNDVRLRKLEADVSDLTELAAEILSRLPEKAPEEGASRPVTFETPEGRALYEETVDAASDSRRGAYSARKKYKDLYDVATAGYEAEGDVWSDMHILHADWIRRRSRWNALEKRMSHGKGIGPMLLKALPWVVALVIGSLTVYGIVDQPATYQFTWDRIASDIRLQIVLGSTVVIILGAVIIWLWRSRRAKKQEG